MYNWKCDLCLDHHMRYKWFQFEKTTSTTSGSLRRSLPSQMWQSLAMFWMISTTSVGVRYGDLQVASVGFNLAPKKKHQTDQLTQRLFNLAPS